jgi:hypothetical protein
VCGASNKESIDLCLKLAEGYKDMGENAKAIEWCLKAKEHVLNENKSEVLI